MWKIFKKIPLIFLFFSFFVYEHLISSCLDISSTYPLKMVSTSTTLLSFSFCPLQRGFCLKSTIKSPLEVTEDLVSAKSHGCFSVSVFQKFSTAFATSAYLLLCEIPCLSGVDSVSPPSLLLSDISFLITFGDADLLSSQVDMPQSKNLALLLSFFHFFLVNIMVWLQ